jgi:hypothetical protein
LVDVAVAAQNTAAQDALLEFISFDDAYDEDIPERYLFATSFTTHPPERVLSDLLVGLHIMRVSPVQFCIGE